jgi:type I restriction enzyme, S subunit
MTTLSDAEDGPVPDGWEVRAIRDLCHIWSGGTPRKTEPAFWKGDIPWVSGKDLKAPQLDDSIDHISPEGLDAGSRLAPAGAVFVLVRGMGLAKDLPIAVARRPMAFNQDIKALVSRTGLSGLFIRSAIYHAKDRLLSRIVPSAHGTMTLNLDDVENLSILVPNDPAEAKVIASALDLIQQAISIEKRQLEATADFRRAAMRTLFTRGLNGEAQKETEIGLVPQSWDVVDFGTARNRLQYGTSTRCTYDPAGLPVLRIPNIEPGHVNALDLKFAQLPSAEASRYQLEAGDLIFIRTNGVIERLGSCAVYAGEPRDALFASYLIRAQIKLDKLDPYFAAYFFSSELGTGIIAGRATPAADGKYNLNTSTIDGLPVPLPPTLAEQRDIVAILDAIDRKIDLHKRKRAVLDELFKSLLHKLMTGEIRVGDLDLSALNSPEVASVAA